MKNTELNELTKYVGASRYSRRKEKQESEQ